MTSGPFLGAVPTLGFRNVGWGEVRCMRWLDDDHTMTGQEALHSHGKMNSLYDCVEKNWRRFSCFQNLHEELGRSSLSISILRPINCLWPQFHELL